MRYPSFADPQMKGEGGIQAAPFEADWRVKPAAQHKREAGEFSYTDTAKQ